VRVLGALGRWPILAGVLLCMGLAACGSTGPSTGASSTTVASQRALRAAAHERDGDGDNDSLGRSRYDSDNDANFDFGVPAGAAERQAISALVRSYYEAAAGDDGKRACALTYWLTAEAIVEEHDRGKGPHALRGSTCAEVLSKLFAGRHRELVGDLGRLEVRDLQIRRNQGWLVLDPGPARERVVFVHRVGAGWRLSVALDAGAL
jgi:hypothetical protein